MKYCCFDKRHTTNDEETKKSSTDNFNRKMSANEAEDTFKRLAAYPGVQGRVEQFSSSSI